MSLWDEDRVNRYLKMYGDPRDQKGSQSILCRDATNAIMGDSVLDVGCGMGHLIPWIRDKRYVGIDFSQEMLEALHKRFPLIVTHHLDATKPFPVTLGSYDTTISISLVIHLPTLDDVRALFRNMWEVTNKAMIFGVESEADRVQTRPDGLTLRSIGLNTVKDILFEELEVDFNQISWVNQKYIFNQQIVLIPSKDNPISIGTKLTNRTSIFKVTK